MSDAGVTTRPMSAADWAAFEPLWAGYLAFYKTTLAPEISRLAFERLVDPARADMGAVVAERAGVVIGFATYVLHPSTWADAPYCYLEDLFTAPAARGVGAGRALIEAVATIARRAGSPKLYWQTHETNATARRLYDRAASFAGFIVYQQRL